MAANFTLKESMIGRAPRVFFEVRAAPTTAGGTGALVDPDTLTATQYGPDGVSDGTLSVQTSGTGEYYVDMLELDVEGFHQLRLVGTVPSVASLVVIWAAPADRAVD